MSERFLSAQRQIPEESPKPRSANDSEFGEESNYVVSPTPTEVLRPFPLIDVKNLEVIGADDEFAKTSLKPRLTRADFEPETIRGARLEAQELSPTAYAYTETVVADTEFAKHRQLKSEDFTEEAILKTRQIAQGIVPANTSPSKLYTAFHTNRRIDTNQEVPLATIKPVLKYEESAETKTIPKYKVTVHESTRNTTPEEYKRTGNLINPNGEKLSRKDFAKGALLPLPTPREMVTEQKPSLFKRFVPSFLKRFFK